MKPHHAMKGFPRSFGLLMCAALTACITWKSEINYLAIVSTEYVGLYDGVGESSWRVVGEGQGRRFLRIRVATTEDLVQLARDRDVSTIRWVTYFCDEGPDRRQFFAGSSIYTGVSELWLVMGNGGPERNATQSTDGRYMFSIVLENPAPIVTTEYIDGEQQQLGMVDVLNPSKPVCFHFLAGRMGNFGNVIESNVVPVQTWSQIMGIDAPAAAMQ